MWEYILLGILQGITEWLPISSKSIVALTSQFLNIKTNPLDLALFLHVGTLLAALIYFRKDWISLPKKENRGLLKFLAISTILSLAIGFMLYKTIKNIAVGNALLLLTGVGLLITALLHHIKGTWKIKESYVMIIAGILQGCSAVPGFSRSGSTMFGLSLGNFQPQTMLKISYMMSVPVVAAATGYIALNNPAIIAQAWISLVTSFVVGITSLHVLMKTSQRLNFSVFCLLFGLLCIVGAVVGWLV